VITSCSRTPLFVFFSVRLFISIVLKQSWTDFDEICGKSSHGKIGFSARKHSKADQYKALKHNDEIAI